MLPSLFYWNEENLDGRMRRGLDGKGNADYPSHVANDYGAQFYSNEEQFSFLF
jgi:hypothetical protein